MAAQGPGCVKTLRGITAPGILRLVVTLRAKKRKNSSSDRCCDQIRFLFTQPGSEAGVPITSPACLDSAGVPQGADTAGDRRESAPVGPGCVKTESDLVVTASEG